MRRTTLTLLCAPALLFLFSALAHRPPENPRTNPELAIENSIHVPPPVQALLKNACYDCHSSQTKWPWYESLPVLSDLIQRDVKKGRAALNFSEWSVSAGARPARAASVLTAACIAVQYGVMPKSPYPYMHSEARLTPADKQMLCDWTREQSAILRARAAR